MENNQEVIKMKFKIRNLQILEPSEEEFEFWLEIDSDKNLWLMCAQTTEPICKIDRYGFIGLPGLNIKDLK
jgi:hypothetical protein